MINNNMEILEEERGLLAPCSEPFGKDQVDYNEPRSRLTPSALPRLPGRWL